MTQSTKPRFTPVLRSLLEEDARAMGHATPEQLLDRHFGRLPPEQADLLDRHLRGCQECAGLLRDLAEFEEFTPPPAAEALGDSQARAAWERLEGRLVKVKPLEEVRTSRPIPVVPPKRAEPPRSPWWRRPEPAWALAAVLCLCVVGLGAWVAGLDMKVRRLSEPSVNVAMLELHTDAVRGTERPVILGGGDSVLFLLEPPEGQPSAGLRAEIHKPGVAEPLVKAGGLHKMQTGTLNFQVSRSLLPPGDYQLDLFVEGAGSTPLTSYPFSVSSP